ERKVAVGVEQARHRAARADRTPAVAGPFAVEGEVDAEVGLRVGLRPARGLREPRAWDEDAGRGDPALLEGLQAGAVDGMGHPDVVGVDDEQARARRMAEPLLDGGRGGLRAGAARPEGQRSKSGHEHERQAPHPATALVSRTRCRSRPRASVVAVSSAPPSAASLPRVERTTWMGARVIRVTTLWTSCTSGSAWANSAPPSTISEGSTTAPTLAAAMPMSRATSSAAAAAVASPLPAASS